ncbi:MAG TPA: nuclear transport factor 2 family protein, partial [Streptosporangiaceae bacterium]|nr:nuclear transport factor 2 family protein [Streptosporangiaceae bacterium]
GGMYGPLFRDSPELRVANPRRIVSGDYLIDEEEISGFNLAGFPPAMRAVVVYRIRDGLIRDVVFLL